MEDRPDRSWIERVVANSRVRAAYASLLAHVCLLLLLTLLAAAASSRPPAAPLVLSLPLEPEGDLADLPAGGLEIAPLPADGRPGDDAAPPPALEPPPEPVSAIAIDAPLAPAARTDRGPLAEPVPGDLAGSAGPAAAPAPAPAPLGTGGRAATGDAFAGRRGPGRSAGVAARGGTAASEAAVERGLEWLARHQADDGSWRFDLSGCRCDGACGGSGTVASTTAATGIALLPFLGAGHTQLDGRHRETVTRGIYYLMSRLRPSPRGGDLGEGTMYGHAVATLALAEALGMTSDKVLAGYVADAVRFTETSQDLHGGGWRYLPGQPGDTTVTAWQLAALKSAALAGAAVPSPTIDGVCRFLDRVQVRGGEGYGYLAPQDRPCTSAIGLLCRVYTGWPETDTIDRGLARLARTGPAPEAVYTNFYLAQALLLRDHPAWPRWNARHRDQLVARQARVGHEAGSWTFADPDTQPGGRLGHTALAILTLEVYYRLLPIYRPEAAEIGF